jgi:hypothetical protein
MVVILIRRCVKPDKEAEFLESYKNTAPKHADFMGETLTKLRLEGLSESMKGLGHELGCSGCITYLNVARLKFADSFEDALSPFIEHDVQVECCPKTPCRIRRGVRDG